MVLTIALKEFYNNLVSARFTIGLLLCLLLIPFSIFINIGRYNSMVRAYEMNQKWAEERSKVRVWSAVRPSIVKPTEPLSIFCNGIIYNVENSVHIMLGEKPFLATHLQHGPSPVHENPFMNSFFTIDFTGILAILISLMALLFTYDACSGERESGTLRLMLSNSISRATILWGKVLGIVFTLLPILLLCYIISFLIILFTPNILFSANEWTRTGMLIIAGVLCFGVFMSIGLFISSRIKSSVISIIMCLFVWATFLFIVPNLSTYLARSLVKVHSLKALNISLQDIDKTFMKKSEEYRNSLKQPDCWMHDYHRVGSDGYRQLGLATGSVMEFYRQLNSFAEPMRIEFADKKWQLQKVYLDNLEKQRIFAEAITLISPSEIFRSIASAICRSDAMTQYRFLEQTRVYREQVIDYFKAKKVFDSYKYFTTLPPEKFINADEMVRFETDGKFNSLKELQAWWKEHGTDFSVFKKSVPGGNPYEYPLLDLSDMPKFQYKFASLSGDVVRTSGKLGIMSVIIVLFFFFSFISFTRYDVR